MSSSWFEMGIHRAYNLRSEKLSHDPWKGKAPSTLVSLCCILGAFFSLRRQISSKWLLLFNVIHISPQILFIPALLLFCLNFLWLFDFSGILEANRTMTISSKESGTIHSRQNHCIKCIKEKELGNNVALVGFTLNVRNIIMACYTAHLASGATLLCKLLIQVL